MDNRYIATQDQKIDLMFWRNAMRMNTSIPAIVDSFDTTTQRVSAIPAIKAKYITPDNEVQYIDYPKITNIPLAVQKTAGLEITIPVKKGDLCTLIFSQRSIDNLLLDSSKPAKPFEGPDPRTSALRCFDMTDAMCFPGIITKGRTISNYNNSAIEIRSDDGTVKVSVSQNALNLTQGSASISMSGGKITISGSTVTINGKDWDTHKHKGVTTGSGNTGVVA